jgi:hypothetical protein
MNMNNGININNIQSGMPASNILGAISGKSNSDSSIMSALEISESQKENIRNLNESRAAVTSQITPEELANIARRMKTKTLIRKYKKIGRNDPCPCGSGKSYKKCCMGKGTYEGYE